jgi:hypothetical protein
MESRLSHASEFFRLFGKLPVSYCVHHVNHSEDGGADNAVFYYVNRKFEEERGSKFINMKNYIFTQQP